MCNTRTCQSSAHCTVGVIISVRYHAIRCIFHLVLWHIMALCTSCNCTFWPAPTSTGLASHAQQKNPCNASLMCTCASNTTHVGSKICIRRKALEENKKKGGQDLNVQSRQGHLQSLVMARPGIIETFANMVLDKKAVEEETQRLIFSNSHLTIDLLSPIIWAALLSIAIFVVAMAFEIKTKFAGFTNGYSGDRTLQCVFFLPWHPLLSLKSPFQPFSCS